MLLHYFGKMCFDCYSNFTILEKQLHGRGLLLFTSNALGWGCPGLGRQLAERLMRGSRWRTNVNDVPWIIEQRRHNVDPRDTTMS